MSRLQIIKNSVAWLKAYNDHDLDVLINCYDENASNIQLPWQREIVGAKAIRATYERTFAAFPDIQINMETMTADSERAAILWEFGGTMKGEFAGQKPTGRKFKLRGCEVLYFVNDKIYTQMGYWDKSTMFMQLGL